MTKPYLDLPTVETFEQQSSDTLRQARRFRSLVWLTLIFWGSNFVLSTLGTALSGNPRLWPITGALFLTMSLGLLFCFLIHLALRRLPTIKRRLLTLAIIAPIAAETFAWAVFFAEAAVDPTLTLKNFQWSLAIRTIAFWTWFFLAWAGAYLAVSYSYDLQDEQERASKLKELAHVAQLRALHNQINPHFLFNSLNSVSSLILDKENERAEAMVNKLANLLRRSLAVDPKLKIPLSEEIQLQRAYLEMEELRFDDLKVEVDVPDDLASIQVPALILQPIVENAVKYGVARSSPPTWIRIEASREDGHALIRIANSAGNKKAVRKGNGIGLSNVLQRLKANFPEDEVSLQLGELADGSFAVDLRFPVDQR